MSAAAVRKDMLVQAANSPIEPPRTRQARGRPGAAAERRYLRVMFCDLVGSTGIAA